MTSVTARPAWWPCDYPAAMVGRVFRYRMGAEKLRLKKPKRVPPSHWAPKHRVIMREGEPRAWRNETAAYQHGIMDAIMFPSVEHAAICKPPQSGLSEAVNTVIGTCIDVDPGDGIMVYPDDETKKLNFKDRIQPMIKRSRRLSRYLTGDEADLSGSRIRLQHMNLYAASAGSDSQLANKPCKYAVADEVDKYEQSKDETSAVLLTWKRTMSYRGCGRKMIELSSPTKESGTIWQDLFLCQVIFHYWVRCPHCGSEQLMRFGQIKWDGKSKADPAEMRAYNLAWYECEHCSRPWTDDDRDDAVRVGKWRASSNNHPLFTGKDAALGDALGMELFEYLEKYQPVSIGFHFAAWVSPFVGLSECAAAFLLGLKDKIRYRDFCNGFEAVPWQDIRAERSEDVILALRDDRPRGMVPRGGVIAGLTAGVDTQDNGLVFEIRAWGWGFVEESWCVREGFLPIDWKTISPEDLQGRPWPYHPGFDQLRKVLWEDTYCDSDGVEYPVRLSIIDSGGHHTTEVYDFCRMHRSQIRPFKGEQRMSPVYKYSDLATYPGSNKKIPGGLQLLRADVTHYKDRLSDKLEVIPANPGAWRYHAETSKAWAREMTSEYKDPKTGYWVCPKGTPNHGWDTAVYNLIAVDILGLKMWRQEPVQAQATPVKVAVNPYTGGRQLFGRGV